MKLHHIGAACLDLELAAATLTAQGFGKPLSDRVWDEAQQAWLQMLVGTDGTRIELVQGPRVEALAKRGVSLYHICFTVTNLDNELKAQLEAGAVLVAEPQVAPMFHGKRAAFIKTPMGLVELLEESGPLHGSGEGEHVK